jgi:hypothetical protein
MRELCTINEQTSPSSCRGSEYAVNKVCYFSPYLFNDNYGTWATGGSIPGRIRYFPATSRSMHFRVFVCRVALLCKSEASPSVLLVSGLLMWGALSDERTVLSFARVTVRSNKSVVSMYHLYFICY